MKELLSFKDYELAKDNDELFVCRLKIEEAMQELKKIKANLDEELIRRMKEDGIKSFNVMLGENMSCVRYGKVKKQEITNTKKLKEMLTSESHSDRELALNALSDGQSAWKISQVKILQDTIGLEGLVKTTYGNKIEVQVVPVDLLKAKGVI